MDGGKMSPTYHQNETPLPKRDPIAKLKSGKCEPVEVRTDFSEFIQEGVKPYTERKYDASQERWTEYCAKGDFTKIEPDMLKQFIDSGYLPYNVIAAMQGESITLDDLNEKVIDRFVQSGWNLIRDVNKTKNDLVVDLACATNPYKRYIPNLCAIDIEPYPGVDIQTSFVHTTLKSNSADVVLCMGGQTFRRRFRKMIFGEIFRILKPGGRVYFRSSMRRLQQFACRLPRTDEGKCNPGFKELSSEDCRQTLEIKRRAFGFRPQWHHDFQYCEHQGHPEMSVMSPILMSISKDFSDSNDARNASWMSKGGHHYFWCWEKKDISDPVETIDGTDYAIKEDGTYGIVSERTTRGAYATISTISNNGGTLGDGSVDDHSI